MQPMLMRHILAILILVTALIGGGGATHAQSIRYHDEAVDTLRVAHILGALQEAQLSDVALQIDFVARQFLGTPYVAKTLEGVPEQLTINTSQLDCTTLVETVIAVVLSATQQHPSHYHFVSTLRMLRYRDGVVNGYASRLHYVSDWIIENTRRGNFSEVTHSAPGALRSYKKIDFISTHSHAYPALENAPDMLEQIVAVERNFDQFSFHYIPKNLLNDEAINLWLQVGDILLITTSVKGLDVSHMGIVVEQDGMKTMLHASSQEGKVIIEKRPLYDYLQAHKSMTGLRVVRL